MNRIAKALMLMIFTTNLAFADSDYDNYYLELGGGYVFASQNSSISSNSNRLLYAPNEFGASLFQFQNVDWNNHFKNGFAGDATIGMKFTNWRFDGEFLYQNIQRKMDGSYNWIELDTEGNDVFAPQFNTPFNDSTTRAQLYTLLMNVYYDFNINARWTPFVGAGIGVSWVNSDTTTTSSTLIVTDTTQGTTASVPVVEKSPLLSGNPFAWQVKGGLAYNFNPNVSLVAIYRLFGTTSISSSSSFITVNPNSITPTTFYVKGGNVTGFLTNEINLTLRYIF
jgi:opacity protein-like surface antigen